MPGRYLYLWDLMMRGVVRNFGTKEAPSFYTVPQSGRMTMCAYECERATGLVTGVPFAPMDVLHKAVLVLLNFLDLFSLLVSLA